MFIEKNKDSLLQNYSLVKLYIGRLVVNVFGQNQGEPIENAKIRVMDSSNNQIVFQLVTNSSGKSDTINIDALNPDYVLEPGAPRSFILIYQFVSKLNWALLRVGKLK